MALWAGLAGGGRLRSTILIFLAVLSAIAAAPGVPGQAPAADIGIDEHLGTFLPKDLVFLDEAGKPVRLGELIRKPTLLALVYFRCPGICTPLLEGLADVLNQLRSEPGKDFQVVTISFHAGDTPELARQKKANFLKILTRPFPPESWHWLTGDQAAIDAVTAAVGFRYVRQGKDYAHPGAIYFISDQGKICRYLYGIRFLPNDVELALMEASEGRTSASINRVLNFCYSYDPVSKTYVFNFLKVAGVVTLLVLALFVIVLVVISRKRKTRRTDA
ncbi:MAG: SCO family protein [Acidobacteria bacterium]|nr:SCO family protein [Acidobacteriota bacterium]